MQKIAHYCSSLVFLAAAAIIYQMLSSAWLRPPAVQTVRPREELQIGADPALADLFPDGAWQRGPCKRLRTDDGVLLFEKWEQTNEDHWKLWPITLVVGRGMSGDLDPEPVILEASQGAEIKFTESLDVMSGGAPPIERGQLIGKVHIRRPDKSDESQSLSIRTSNVGINNRKVWTTETIRMKVGQATMVGRDLTLFLSVAAGSAPRGSSVSAVLDRMQLTYLDELLMPLEDGALWEAKTATPEQPVRLPATRSSTPLPAMISVRCGGRVDYDFAIDQLSLRDSISLIHQVPGGIEDRFDCDAIDLNLRNPADKTIPRRTPLDWISRMTATGSPAVMKMPSFELELKAERIDFDALAGLIKAGGRNGVEIHRGPVSARLTQLAYQYDPNRPKAIGAIDAFGAGIVTLTDNELALKEVRWREGFKLQPSGVVEIDTVDSDLQFWVDGLVEAKFADGGKFEANAIEGVLKPVNNREANQAKDTLAFVPDRIQASGDVRIDTAAIAAQTQVLRLYFDHDADPAADTIQPDKQAGSTMRQWVVQPGSTDGTVDPVARPRPVIRGDLISAQLRFSDSGAQARDLSVIGSVEIDHVVNVGDNMLPTQLTGEELRLSTAAGRDVLKLGSGDKAPAKLSIADGYFIGPMILIWPSENLVQIQGAGEFQMPTAILPTALMSDDPGRITWTKPPHCKWNGELRFDGKTAVLTDGVDIRASLLDGREPWGMHLMGEQLEIVLLEDVEVSQVQSIKRAAIQQIKLLQSVEHPVIVNAERRAADGVLESRHVLHAPQLTLLPSGGGKLLGAGPGWYRGWMYAPNAGLLSAADDSSDTQSSPQLTGVHLTYHEAIEGDLTSKTLAFIKGVRVGVQPIQTWKDIIDAKTMDEISTGESTLDCDRLGFAVAPGYADGSRSIPGVPTPWEMEAISGVFFRTRRENGLLEATADRASYTSGKDLFTIQGAPNRGAVIRQTKPNGQPGPHLNVKDMTIKPKTFEIVDSKILNFQLGTLPSSDLKR